MGVPLIFWKAATFLVLLVKVLLGIILIPIFILWKPLVCLYVKLFKSDEYGASVNYLGSMISSSEDYNHDPTAIGVVGILSLDGPPLSLEELKEVFENNVLNCRDPSTGKVRYPELKQYQVTCGGYWFWKNEPNFRIGDHVKEVVFPEGIVPPPDEIFREVLNKAYTEFRSPWELTLAKSGKADEEEGGQGGGGRGNKVVLIFRMHHSMADAKSLVKLLVEALGQKELKSTKARPDSKRLLRTLQAYLLFLYHVISKLLFELPAKQRKIQGHPWIIHDIARDKSPFVYKTSRPIPLGNIKSIARRHNMEGSAVIMAILTGAIRRFDPAAAPSGGLPSSWTLPKPDHPPHLTNHLLLGLLTLPTGEEVGEKRLSQCRELYRKGKFSGVPLVTDVVAWLMSVAVVPAQKEMLKLLAGFPVGATNIAGESEGFCVGGRACTDFQFGSTILKSSGGVAFIVFSYKDRLQISAVAKSSILSDQETGRLANSIDAEVEFLQKLESNKFTIVTV